MDLWLEALKYTEVGLHLASYQCVLSLQGLITVRLGWHDYRFTDNSFKCIISKEKSYILINSLRPCDVIWQHRSGPILVQVKSCCLMAPSQLPKLVLTYHQSTDCNSSESKFIRSAHDLNLQHVFRDYTLRLWPHLTGANDLARHWSRFLNIQIITRTTRTHAFWDTLRRSMITHTNDSHQIPTWQVKTRQSQCCKFKKIAKNSNFENLQVTLHATHLMLLDKMHKYKMDPTITAGATGQTRDAGRMDGRTDRRTDEVKPI